jgi:hypothetical protein
MHFEKTAIKNAGVGAPAEVINQQHSVLTSALNFTTVCRGFQAVL